LLLSAILAPALIGCGGGDGPVKYGLEGAVTYQGKPVPRGQIIFAPDSSKGNNGPGSVALIRDGRYATHDDRGVVGGPYRVRVEGFDGVPSGDNADGAALFPAYEIEVDLPKEGGVRDFDVPAQ
jgi:hypothetical protein